VSGAAAVAGATTAAATPAADRGRERPAARGERRRGSPARTTILIVAGVVLGAVALVLALTSLGGSGGSPSASSHAATHTHHTAAAAPSTHATVPANAGEIQVSVLNATETNGLAHHVSAELHHAGFTQATPLGGHPPGNGQTTVVQYAAGHEADAHGVARSLGVTEVQPMEAAVAALAGTATVVVVVGADKAAAGT
jgi:hypothetical protein